MRIKLSYVIVGGLIYYFMFRKSKPNMDYLGYGNGNEGVPSNDSTTWA